MAIGRNGRDETPFSERLRIQRRTIGAVMLRELHTRFGRNNIGYLWLVLEPLLLSGGVSTFHYFSHTSPPFGFASGPYYATGYITYIIFRNNVNRAGSLIESNRTLLYHRNVTLLDMSIARVLLDLIATFCAMVIICTVFYIIGQGSIPERPWLTVAALLLMGWLSLGVGMIVSGLSEFSTLVDRIVHPMTYLLIPFSGMFSVMDELPPSFAKLNALFPFPHLADLARMGFSDTFNSTYLNLTYVLLFNAIATVIGLVALRVARKRMHFD